MGLSKKQACEILGLTDGTDLEAVLSSYKCLATRWHPIKNKNSEEAKKKFQAVTLAYKTLASPNLADKNMTLSEMLELFQQLFYSRTEYNGYNSSESSSSSSSSSSDEDNFTCKISQLMKNKKDKKGTGDVSIVVYEKNSDGLSEEEKERKKVEKRRAKKKKRKEKKKLEKEAQKDKNEVKSSSVPNSNTKSESNKKSDKKKKESNSSGSDEGLDPCSAFVATATNKNKKIMPIVGIQNKSKLNKQKRVTTSSNGNEEQNKDDLDPVILQSRQLAIRGNEMANLGEYLSAVSLFSEAIKLDPRDYRFFGNRSYCYDRLHQYEKALRDSDKAIILSPNWPKGYFRKGRALAGLKLYSEAEDSYEQVLKLDKNCEDAMQELLRVRTRQLTEMGFTKQLSESAIKQHKTVQTALDALLISHRNNTSSLISETLSEVYISDDENPIISQPISKSTSHTSSSDEKINNNVSGADLEAGHSLLSPKNPEGLPSLWVGNVLPEVPEKTLISMFSKYGVVTSVRSLPEKYCAFINFKTKENAGKAMDALQGVECAGQRLLIKFPDNPQGNGNSATVIKKNIKQSIRNAPKQSGPVNGDECYFWRTTGCIYGDRCRYKHVKDHKGLDKKPWQHPT